MDNNTSTQTTLALADQKPCPKCGATCLAEHEAVVFGFRKMKRTLADGTVKTVNRRQSYCFACRNGKVTAAALPLIQGLRTTPDRVVRVMSYRPERTWTTAQLHAVVGGPAPSLRRSVSGLVEAKRVVVVSAEPVRQLQLAA